MLTERAGRLRDLLLFLALALLPTLAVGVLGLRAIQGEEAAQRREAQSALEASAERVRLRVEQALGEADAALSAARIDPDPQKAEEALARVAPPFAVAVLLDRDRALLIPAAPPAPSPAVVATTERCAELANLFARGVGTDAERYATRKGLLQQCPDARGQGGRFLYPIVALFNPTTDESYPLVAWIEAHAALLSPGEREATREEVAKAWTLMPEQRARALAALRGLPSTREWVAAALRSEAAAAALREGPDRAGMLRFRAAGALGVLRALEDGRLAGLVVHPGSLAAALESGWPGLPSDQRAEIAGAAPARSGPRATAAIAPGLEVSIAPADPAAIEVRASRARRILASFGAGAVVVSLGLLALLWARVRAARRTSELRVDFVSAVSHELRTPVSSLRMLAELLAEGRVEPEEQREVFEALARESKRLGDTVERMLSLGRMAKGRLTAVRAAADVGRVAGEAIAAFEERFPDLPPIERHIEEPAEAQVDAGQLRLAIDNLLDNARKYAPEGTPYRVRVQREDSGITVRVEDSGPGIARRDQRRIFEAFERLDDKLSRATEGSGLGLSLVRQVMRAHGGSARVESEPGRGAAFVLFIPGRKS